MALCEDARCVRGSTGTDSDTDRKEAQKKAATNEQPLESAMRTFTCVERIANKSPESPPPATVVPHRARKAKKERRSHCNRAGKR
ncbi:hypothetical protein E2C01_089033 [Portunus trituberculatus]|uniref:Uncharacterized protein n=1 Tax=Portunus trituberculatus TaxID=210409 RepID=A0A5B7JLF7_PORTR|nr:hypothetical protein [Portunus trituberculatus]